MMRIVDAQIHLWGSGLPSNMAHRQVTAFTTEDALGMMDEGGVDAAVIHPPGWDPRSHEMAGKAVRDFPGRFAILGSVPLDQPDKRGLVDFALEVEREKGLSPEQSIYQACVLRFRPILMTTMAALLGGVPLMLGSGAGSEIRQPLGYTIVGGLILSQVLTLFTTPVVYLYLDRLQGWLRRRGRATAGPAAEAS